jgi:histidine triad (HIT) family protein
MLDIENANLPRPPLGSAGARDVVAEAPGAGALELAIGRRFGPPGEEATELVPDPGVTPDGWSAAHRSFKLAPAAEAQAIACPLVPDCIFCVIAAGEAPATMVDEDENTISCMDINPWRPGHTLVVPKRHYENLLDVDAHDLAKTLEIVRRLASQMTERLDADGVVTWNSCGEAAGQVVMHFHVHVIPTKGDPPELPRPERLADEADIAAAAAALRGEG